VAGYLLPGKPIANVTFKCMGYMTLAQALGEYSQTYALHIHTLFHNQLNFFFLLLFRSIDLVSDLKLGHYLKIPPRDMFKTQVLGTMLGCVINLIVVKFVLSENSGYRGYLDGSIVDPTGQWDGRKVHIFYRSVALSSLTPHPRVQKLISCFSHSL